MIITNEQKAIVLMQQVLTLLGEDTTREGLIDTPKRYVKFLSKFLNHEPFNFTTFENEGNDEMIVVKNIPFYSLCEHHTLPFFGTACIGYLPDKKLAGLSKLARVVYQFSHRLQNQERLTNQISTKLNILLKPFGVATILTAQHLCMEMRGVNKPGAVTTTSAMTGRFLTDINCRQEFLNLIK